MLVALADMPRVTAAHIYRLFTHFQVVVGSHALPEWVSYVAIVVTAGLSWMLCREARGTSGP